MTEKDSSRAEEIFLAATELPTAEREGYVRNACSDDAELRAEVEALLAADAAADENFLVQTDAEFEQQVAVKLIRPGMDSADLLERFRQERQLLATLAHPNIARLLDGGLTAESRPYLAMEYVDGQPIDR